MATTTASSATPTASFDNSCDDLLQQLPDELSSLKRVRNRLAMAPKERLSHILNALLPKLLQRLIRYYHSQRACQKAWKAEQSVHTLQRDPPLDAVDPPQEQQGGNSRPDDKENHRLLECLRLLHHIQVEVNGILAHAVERIRSSFDGKQQEHSTESMSWIQAIIPFAATGVTASDPESTTGSNVEKTRQDLSARSDDDDDCEDVPLAQWWALTLIQVAFQQYLQPSSPKFMSLLDSPSNGMSSKATTSENMLSSSTVDAVMEQMMYTIEGLHKKILQTKPPTVVEINNEEENEMMVDQVHVEIRQEQQDQRHRVVNAVNNDPNINNEAVPMDVEQPVAAAAAAAEPQEERENGQEALDVTNSHPLALETRLCRSSWLLWDTIIFTAGGTPKLDWDLDDGYYFDGSPPVVWQAPARAIKAMASITSPTLSDSARTPIRNVDGGAGIFHLMLDLLLFAPQSVSSSEGPGATYTGISRFGHSRIRFRRDHNQEQELHLDPLHDHRRRGHHHQLHQQREDLIGGQLINLERLRQRRELRRAAESSSSTWSDQAKTNFRHIQWATLKWAIWPYNHGVLQDVQHRRATNLERALLLSVLVASPSTLHGRLGQDFLTQFKNNFLLYKQYQAKNKQHKRTMLSSSSLLQQSKKPKRSSHSNDTIYALNNQFQSSDKTNDNGKCSLSVACCLLLLIVGDELAQPILNEYIARQQQQGEKSGFSAARSATDNGNNPKSKKQPSPPWEQLLGPLPDSQHEDHQRPPLPPVNAARAVEYLRTYSIDWSLMVGKERASDFAVTNMILLIMDLTLAMANLEYADGALWAMQLVVLFYHQIMTGLELREDELKTNQAVQDDNSNNSNHDSVWRREVLKKCLTLSSRVLTTIVQAGERVIQNNRDRQGRVVDMALAAGGNNNGIVAAEDPPPINLMPLGVPAPFFGRRDLDQLLVRHRVSQQRHHLTLNEYATEARRAAYQLIVHCCLGAGRHNAVLAPVTECKDGSTSEVDSNHTKTRDHANLKAKKLWKWPILLLQCAIHEDAILQPHVTAALDALLVTYKAEFTKSDVEDGGESEGLLRQQQQQQQEAIIPLLPSLLDTVCSDSLFARTAAVSWIDQMLSHVDVLAARHLCFHLLHDPSFKIRSTAENVLNRKVVLAEEDPSPSSGLRSSFRFLNSKKEEDVTRIRADVEARIKKLQSHCEANNVILPLDLCQIVLHDFEFSFERALQSLLKDYDSVAQQCGFALFDRQSLADPLNLSVDGQGIPVGAGASPSTNENDSMDISSGEGAHYVCGICYDDELDEADVLANWCGDRFCLPCWKSYITSSLEEGGNRILQLRCPQHDCNERVTVGHIRRIAPEIEANWQNAFLDSFVKLDSLHRFCPGADCCMIAKLELSKPSSSPRPKDLPVTCTACETSFCIGCGEAPHQPACCQDMAEWAKLYGSSTFWIKKNAKPCPGCGVPIEKNRGCNHMTCNQCRTEFCWLCLSKLEFHSEPHTCNQYNPSEDAANNGDRQERWALFAAERFHAHDDAGMFARNQAKVVMLDENAESQWFPSEDERDILGKALNTLARSRDFLKYSYIASLTMIRQRQEHERRGDPEKAVELLDRWQSHQATLELFTERMSQLTETNLRTLKMERGSMGVAAHFRALFFYQISVENYMERMQSITS